MTRARARTAENWSFIEEQVKVVASLASNQTNFLNSVEVRA
jgi:hypothetical protein